LVAAAKLLVAATKKLFVVPNFVAVTKPFFFRAQSSDQSHTSRRQLDCVQYGVRQLIVRATYNGIGDYGPHLLITLFFFKINSAVLL